MEMFSNKPSRFSSPSSKEEAGKSSNNSYAPRVSVTRYSDWLRAGRSDELGSIAGGGWVFFS